MATSSDLSQATALNPAAGTFSIREEPFSNGTPPTESLANGSSKPPKQPIRPDKGHSRNSTAENVAEAGAGAKLTVAELKKHKAAEKAARRAEKIAEKGAQTPQVAPVRKSSQSGGPRPDIQRRPSTSKKEGEGFHKRSGSIPASKQLPVRNAQPVAEMKEKPKEEKKVPMFSHLYNRERRATIAGAGKEIHPAVLALGLQLRDYVICGGTARCVAMLLVFKKVIQAYTTPAGTALSRNLTTHLSHQISYLSLSRPLSVSQGNSIRWLKKLISALDPDLSDIDARQFLGESIDQFIREKFTLADELIQKEASSRINDGDVILTFAKSSIVEKTLLAARKQRKRFRVIVVDSRPLFEGKNLARRLSAAGIQVRYSLLSGLAAVVGEATKCFLGASAMMGNGRLYSRSGTALVAMMAKEAGRNVPVVVLSQSVKFTGRVALDSIVMNELGDANALVELGESQSLTTEPQLAPAPLKGGKKGKDDDDKAETKQKTGLDGWKDQENLHLLNLMYDVTPAALLDMVITELGSLPPSAVPVVNGVHGDDE